MPFSSRTIALNVPLSPAGILSRTMCGSADSAMLWAASQFDHPPLKWSAVKYGF